jgi:hypothetical protein
MTDQDLARTQSGPLRLVGGGWLLFAISANCFALLCLWFGWPLMLVAGYIGTAIVGSRVLPLVKMESAPLPVFVFACCALFISDDLFLVLRAGFVFRAVQVGLILAIVLWLLKPGRFVRPLGFNYLLVWAGFIFAFVLNVPHFGLTRNLGYAVWLLYNIGLVAAAVNLLDSEDKLRFVLRWYVMGFFLLAVYGLLQFIGPLVGVAIPFTQQFWFPGLARINGISYEPSYYATYMAGGFVLIDYLIHKEQWVLSRRAMLWGRAIVLLALLVCSSRIGWIVLCAWEGIRILWWVPKMRFRHLVWTSAAVACLLMGLNRTGVDVTATLLRGLVASDKEEAFSLDDRRWDLQNTIDVAKEHLVVGVSLGGVGSYIAQNTARIPLGPEYDKIEGQCTTIEVLAASGIFGFMFYLAYIGTLLWLPFQTDSPITKALAWSTGALLLALQLNQNILRVVLWFIIALLSASYSLATKGPERHSRTSY